MTDALTYARSSRTAVPPGRGRWRLTLHRRTFDTTTLPVATGLDELHDARSRRLETALNKPAQLTFTVDGRSPSAVELVELATEVLAWRWSDELGADVLMFRGVVTASEDTVSEQSHAVNFTALDYLALLVRRFTTGANDWVLTGVEQDQLVEALVAGAMLPAFLPGSQLPLVVQAVAPDGSPRGPSGVVRDRTYPGQTSYGQAIIDLGATAGGFAVDVAPTSAELGHETLRVWFPDEGVVRTDLVLVYGGNVASLTRSINSQDFANYVRVIGDSGQAGEGVQFYAEAASPTADEPPLGLWMAGANASDVKTASALAETAAGALATSTVLTPAYSLKMRPGTFAPGRPAQGDTVPLVVRSGRLDVSTTVRVLGTNYAITDDGAEDVELTVGRPALSLTATLARQQLDIDALARR